MNLKYEPAAHFCEVVVLNSFFTLHPEPQTIHAGVALRGDTGVQGRSQLLHGSNPQPSTPERECFIDKLLVRIHFIIVLIRWTGLAPWVFKFPFSLQVHQAASASNTFLTAAEYFVGAEQVMTVGAIDFISPSCVV